MDFWRYRQLHHFFKTQGDSIRDISSLTPFKRLFIAEEPILHMVSELYQLLSSASPAVKPSYIRAWEWDLETVFTPAQLSSLYELTQSSSIDSKTQEINYKILMRWYRVPADLARIYPPTPDQCWRGCSHKGTLLHIWWDCPVIRLYWEDIKSQIKEIMGIDIPLSPVHFLLHIPPTPMSQYKKSVLPHLLNADKRLLPIFWRHPQTPNREEWHHRVGDIREAEDWIATCRGVRDRFTATWQPWTVYVSDPGHMPSSLDVALLELAEPSLRGRPQGSQTGTTS